MRWVVKKKKNLCKSNSFLDFFPQSFYPHYMQAIINLILSAIAVVISAYVLPGVHVNNFWTAIVVAVVLGILNAIIKPILLVLTLPINILTLGLFTFIINGIVILLVSSIVPGFKVDGFLWAILFSFVLSIVNGVISAIK